MPKKIYLTGIEKKPGKSFISLGVLSVLKTQYPALQCFKLFGESNELQSELLSALTNSAVKPVMEINEGIAMLRDQPETLFAKVLDATRSLSHQDVAFFEGSDFESDIGASGVFEYEFNVSLAYQLNCDLILVVSAKDRTLAQIGSLINSALEISKKNHARVTAVILNCVLPNQEQETRDYFQKKGHFPEIIIVPEFDYLAHPSVNDVALKLQAKIICGTDALDRMVNQLTVAAKTVGNFLESRLDRKDMLIITPCDRVDILLGSLLADQSANYPKIAGIVLTGGDMPGEAILSIIKGLEHPFPVLLTSTSTYETATILYSAKYRLNIGDRKKVDASIQAMLPYLSSPIIKLLAQKETATTVSPAFFLYELVNKATQIKRHIVLPEGHDPRVLKAADYILKRKIASITLLGDIDKMTLLAKRLQLDLPDVQMIEIEKSPKKQHYAEEYFRLRQHKNVNLPIALERMTDVNYFAVMMVYCGDADGMVSGAEHTTADTVRPALEIIKTKTAFAKVSSIFIMCMPTRVLIYGDCAINTEPDSETLADIAFQAADITARLGLEPKVALLSYSTGDSGKGESVDKVAKAMTFLHEKAPHLLAEGPIQYDAAVDKEVAHKKLPRSKLAGTANVLIFPDLNTGNNTYKAVQRESGALAIGPVLLGLNKPVNDLSRGCTAQDIINTILVTAIQCGDNHATTDH